LSPIWIKICGITRAEDALAVEALGVDAIGLVFYARSARAVSPAQAERILARVSDKLQVFALFVNPDRAQVLAALSAKRIDHLQFHGEESASFCQSFGLPYMKAFQVQSSAAVLERIQNYESAKHILLDSYEVNVPGGTGKTFDWTQAATIVAQSKRQVVLAGGLQPENVGKAIASVRPFGVDVSSGVEAAPGIKDMEKLQSFVRGVRSVES
jgi:phosphoribosylanthranilate isomerase